MKIKEKNEKLKAVLDLVISECQGKGILDMFINMCVTGWLQELNSRPIRLVDYFLKKERLAVNLDKKQIFDTFLYDFSLKEHSGIVTDYSIEFFKISVATSFEWNEYLEIFSSDSVIKKAVSYVNEKCPLGFQR